MGHFKVNRKDCFFILKNQLHYGSLCSLDRYKGLTEKTLDMVVNEAIDFAMGVIDPLQEIGEERGVVFENNKVSSPPEFRNAFKEYGRQGWTAAARDVEYGGQGFPHMMRIIINDFMYGACQAFNMAPSLTHGAAHLIESFGRDEHKKLFVPKMFDGTWAGTMCLTEPDAGSNLASIQTTARREGDHFKITGSKIFISWGDHDLTENIIHLVIARIEGAPQGVKGISLFIAPKRRVEPDGSLGRPNDVVCTGVEKKMGLHGSPTCTINFGQNNDCIGYLCGEENKGLAHMFKMMNLARINAGVSGLTIASTAYLNALEYSKVRIQGRDIAGKDSAEQPIINHPDVRRMLLWMKGAVDGMRSMVYSGAFWSDLALELPSGKEKEHYQNLCDFLTPIIKAYCSDTGFRVCELAIQCLGGYGYCRDYPLEQYLRDIKIMSIYEGANGIQSMDLMGRKMHINNGAPFNAYKAELAKFFLTQCGHAGVDKRIRQLSEGAELLFNNARLLSDKMKDDPPQWASYTYPALLCFSEITIIWRLLDMAVIAHGLHNKKPSDYLKGKIIQAAYFSDMTLPHTIARTKILIRDERELLDMPLKAF